MSRDCDILHEYLYEIARNPDVTHEELDEALDIHGVPHEARGVFYEVQRQQQREVATLRLNVTQLSDKDQKRTVVHPPKPSVPGIDMSLKSSIVKQYSYVDTTPRLERRPGRDASMVMPAYLLDKPKKGQKQNKQQVRYVDGRAVTCKGGEKYITVE